MKKKETFYNSQTSVSSERKTVSLAQLTSENCTPPEHYQHSKTTRICLHALFGEYSLIQMKSKMFPCACPPTSLTPSTFLTLQSCCQFSHEAAEAAATRKDSVCLSSPPHSLLLHPRENHCAVAYKNHLKTPKWLSHSNAY